MKSRHGNLATPAEHPRSYPGRQRRHRPRPLPAREAEGRGPAPQARTRVRAADAGGLPERGNRQRGIPLPAAVRRADRAGVLPAAERLARHLHKSRGAGRPRRGPAAGRCCNRRHAGAQAVRRWRHGGSVGIGSVFDAGGGAVLAGLRRRALALPPALACRAVALRAYLQDPRLPVRDALGCRRQHRQGGAALAAIGAVRRRPGHGRVVHRADAP